MFGDVDEIVRARLECWTVVLLHGYYKTGLGPMAVEIREARWGPHYIGGGENYVPMSYVGERVAIKLTTLKNWQAINREEWDALMTLGYAPGRSGAGRCIQGLSYGDVDNSQQQFRSRDLDSRRE